MPGTTAPPSTPKPTKRPVKVVLPPPPVPPPMPVGCKTKKCRRPPPPIHPGPPPSRPPCTDCPKSKFYSSLLVISVYPYACKKLLSHMTCYNAWFTIMYDSSCMTHNPFIEKTPPPPSPPTHPGPPPCTDCPKKRPPPPIHPGPPPRPPCTNCRKYIFGPVWFTFIHSDLLGTVERHPVRRTLVMFWTVWSVMIILWYFVWHRVDS